MRILLLNYEYPPVGGGGGRVSEDVARGLYQRGHQVLVLTARAKGLALREERNGIRIVRVPSFRRSLFKASFIVMVSYILAGIFPGWYLIRKWKPDILHVHFAVPTGALGWLLSKVTGIPYILTVHLGDIPGGSPEKTERWFRWIYPFTPRIWKDAQKVIAVSRYTRELALKHYPVDISVIHNGVEIGDLYSSEITVREIPRIIFAGRFVPQKNPLQLVRVLSKIRDLKWECVMLGDGPLLPDVKKAIKDDHLSERISLPGWVDMEKVIEEFSSSDILFMPSRSEGLPMVGVYALASSLAIVGGRVGGFSDVVLPGKNGYLYDTDDVAGMSEGLRKFLEDRESLKKARLASRDHARQFDIKTVVENYERCLLEATANGIEIQS